jgi:hypothetical protein
VPDRTVVMVTSNSGNVVTRGAAEQRQHELH